MTTAAQWLASFPTRRWEETDDGWASHEPDDAERSERRSLAEEWAQASEERSAPVPLRGRR